MCKSNHCPYPNLFQELSKDNSKSDFVEFDLDLPMDNDGYCLFHSRELEWKYEHQFHDRFLELIALIYKYNELNTQKLLFNFTNFCFIGKHELDEDNNFQYPKYLDGLTLGAYGIIPEMPIFCIKDVTFNHNVSFGSATFHSFTIIIDCKFTAYTTFASSCFEDSFVFVSSETHGVTDFSGCKFEYHSYFQESLFNDYTKFPNCQFNHVVEFYRLKFGGEADFTASHFKTQVEDEASVFSLIEFDTVLFNHVIFDCETHFLNVLFSHQADFTNTTFSDVSQTHFYEIQVDNTLIFKGVENNKLFKNRITFSVLENIIKGIIIFENVNFLHIEESDRKTLVELSRNNKVIIGSGCIKYRVQTPLKTLLIRQHNQDVLVEFTQAFTNYFIKFNGFNLGIEVVNKRKDAIDFFYFTDEAITIEKLYERLNVTEKEFWNFKYKDDSTDNISQEEQLREIDKYVSKLSTLTKVGLRNKSKLWVKEEVETLIQSINFGKSTLNTGDIYLLIDKLYVNPNQLQIETINIKDGKTQIATNINNHYDNASEKEKK